MKLATLRYGGTTVAARLTDSGWALIDGYPDLGMLLRQPNWQDVVAEASGAQIPLAGAVYETLVPFPSKIICVGLNYASHIREMGRKIPLQPTLFAKFAETLTGPHDSIRAVKEDHQLDWEGELVIVIGTEAYRTSEEEAKSKIAGYTVANDISMRGWQFRTKEWLQGKIWARSTPVGPLMVTTGDFDYSTSTLSTRVNGELMQEHATGDLVFTPEYLVHYISTMIPLNPGDIILTGTPGGVGHARDPQVYLRAGDIVEVEVEGIGRVTSEIVEAGHDYSN